MPYSCSSDCGRAAAQPQAAPSITVGLVAPTVTNIPAAPSVTIFPSTAIKTIHPSTSPSHITPGDGSHTTTPPSAGSGPSLQPPAPSPVIYAPLAETFASPIAQSSAATSSPLLQILPIFQIAPRQSLSIRSLILFLHESFLGFLNDSIRSANEHRDILYRILREPAPPPHQPTFISHYPPTSSFIASPPRYHFEDPLITFDTTPIISPSMLSEAQASVIRSRAPTSETVPATFVAGLVADIATSSGVAHSLDTEFNSSVLASFHFPSTLPEDSAISMTRPSAICHHHHR